MNTMNGSNADPIKGSVDYVKTVNGKPVGDNCVTCGGVLERNIWLCSKCAHSIGYNKIIDTISNMPEYLADDQYEKWLKLKLRQYVI